MVTTYPHVIASDQRERSNLLLGQEGDGFGLSPYSETCLSLRTTEGSEAISALERGGLLRAIALATTGKVSVLVERRCAVGSLAMTGLVVTNQVRKGITA